MNAVATLKDLVADSAPTARPNAGSYQLAIENLSVAYETRGQVVEAVRGVSLGVAFGEVLALVGESGSGKSTIALAAMGMLPPSAKTTAGSIKFDGVDITKLGERALDRLRGRRLGWIPQDPMVALNPLQRVGKQVAEPFIIHHLCNRNEAQARAIELLGRVGIPDPALRAHQYPHELSGGMRQRVLIAAALAAEPRLIIADEPTTALDVTIQKRILDDIATLTASSGISVLLITHDLAVAAERADRIVVLRHGEIVEEGPAGLVLRNPREAYTKVLLASAPSLAVGRRRHGGVNARRASSPEPEVELLSVSRITKDFSVSRAGGGAETLRAVDGVGFSIKVGETFGLVGESGSGKSTIARMILGLTAPSTGTVSFNGTAVHLARRAERRELRRIMQPIYQNPYSSLNPRFSVADIISEPLDGFGIGTREERTRRTLELLDQVGLPRLVADRRPVELSGGQRQRVAIARALAPNPKLIVCDEPVSALDVSVQAQILALLSELQERHRLSYLFISHDLAVVRQVADRVGVVKDGRLIEIGPSEDIFNAPQHDYTRLLLDSIPGKRLVAIQ